MDATLVYDAMMIVARWLHGVGCSSYLCQDLGRRCVLARWSWQYVHSVTCVAGLLLSATPINQLSEALPVMVVSGGNDRVLCMFFEISMILFCRCLCSH